MRGFVFSWIQCDRCFPSDNHKDIPILKWLLSSLPIEHVEGNLGITLLTIPKGLSLEKLTKMVVLPESKNKTLCSFIWKIAALELGDTSIKKTFKILITNNVLRGSRVQFHHISDRAQIYRNQKEFVHGHDFELPKVLELATLLVVTYMSSGERLYSDSPRTFSNCADFYVLPASCYRGIQQEGFYHRQSLA